MANHYSSKTASNCQSKSPLNTPSLVNYNKFSTSFKLSKLNSLSTDLKLSTTNKIIKSQKRFFNKSTSLSIDKLTNSSLSSISFNKLTIIKSYKFSNKFKYESILSFYRVYLRSLNLIKLINLISLLFIFNSKPTFKFKSNRNQTRSTLSTKINRSFRLLRPSIFLINRSILLFIIFISLFKNLIKNEKFKFFIFFNVLFSNAISIAASRNKISIPGDILLGGIFPVHQKGSTPNTSNPANRGPLCGPINKDRGIQRVEAMLFALDKINHNDTILPTIKLGAIILDTCASDTYALNQSLEFIRASVNTVESSAFECADKSQPKSRYNTKIISGVVGGSYSEVSLQVANLLKLFRIPQVSYASTTTSLSDKTRYDFFARTVPPDVYQARALVDIVASFGWTYVSIVSSEGQYGDSGLSAFVRNARSRNICIAANEKVTHSANTSGFDQIMESLLNKPNAKGVVLFLRMEDARGLLLAAKRSEKYGMFTWIAADGWGKELKLVENVEEIALGAITVELQSETIAEFDTYFKKLSLKSPKSTGHKSHTPITSDKIENLRNPWFREYWQEVFECYLPEEQPTALALNKNLDNNSSDNELMLGDQPLNYNYETINPIFNHNKDIIIEQLFESAYNKGDKQLLKRLEIFQKINQDNKQHKNHYFKIKRQFKSDNELNGRRFRRFLSVQKDQRKQCADYLSLRDVHHKQETKIQFVVDAVYAFAHALHVAWLKKCGGVGKVCTALRDLDGGEFYNNFLLNVSFHDPVGSLVRFDKNGDGLGRYNVYNFQRSKLSSTGFTYKRIGSWSDQGLKLNVSNIFWNVKRVENQWPTSRCSEPCGIGEIKITQSTSETCCWICQQCKPYEFVRDNSRCEDCGLGYWPYENKTACYELPLTYIQLTSYYAIVPIILAVLGILLTLFVFITFIRHLDTPIVRASGRELSFILLFGLIWCFSMTFVLLAKPTTYICALQRFGIGFGFTCLFAPLLTKTNRISRIFDSAKKTSRRPSFISPRSQVIITLALISIQVIETGIWFILEEPGTKRDVSDEKRWLVILKCRVKDTSTLFSLAYNIVLIAICTAYAFKTRKIPENYNESKFIGFTMYTTCIIWLAFIPTYFGMANAYENVRKLTMNSNTYKKPAPSSGIYFPSNQDTGVSMDQLKQHVTLEAASSVSAAGDSSGRFNQSTARYQKNSHTDSTNISYNMPTTVTGTETSDSGAGNYQNSNVCVHVQPNRTSGLAACFDSQINQNGSNRSKIKTTSNKLSVMMYMPGIAAAAIERPELFYTNVGNQSASTFLPGFELRKRSNSFTEGTQTANFLVDNEHLHHHHQLLYQPPFIFNNEVAQRTLNEQQSNQNVDLNRMTNQQTAQYNEHVNQLNDQNFNPKISKVNFNLSNLSNQSDDEENAKELIDNQDSKLKPDEMTAELAERTSQSSMQMVLQVTTGEQDEESQI